jgi:hypothetical protein
MGATIQTEQMDEDNIKSLLFMTRQELRDEIVRLREEVKKLKCNQDTPQTTAPDAKPNTSQTGSILKQGQ